MNHAKTTFSTEICAGATISVVQYLAPLRYKARCLLPASPVGLPYRCMRSCIGEFGERMPHQSRELAIEDEYVAETKQTENCQDRADGHADTHF
jgi:hypothetical protein